MPVWVGTGAGQAHRQFLSEDGVAVHAFEYGQARESTRPAIVAFHPGGSNARAVYGPIIPRLLDEGFAVLAVDLRSGGTRFGGHNATVAAQAAVGKYCEAAPDIEAAVAGAVALFGRPVIFVASSFSGALVLSYVARGVDATVKAVVAFSPASGPAMTDCLPVGVAAGLRVPTLVLGSESEAEGGALQHVFRAYVEAGHEVLVARPGVRGASMLVPERGRGDVGPAWQALLSFLQRVGRA